MADTRFFYYSDSVMFCDHQARDMTTRSGYGFHSHNVYEFLFIKSENVDYLTSHGEYKLSRGDLVITRPYEMHSIIPHDSVTYERYDILIDEQMLGFPFTEKLRDGHAPISLANNKAFCALFDKFDFYSANLSGDELKAVFHSLAREMCVNILMEISGNSRPVTADNAIVRDALEYINSNLMSISSVEEIANALFITKSHLHHLFSRHLKTPPKKYITERRLSLAKKELANGARPSDIFARYGFSDYSSFFRAYKSQFGISPTVKFTPERASVTPESTIIHSDKDGEKQ